MGKLNPDYEKKRLVQQIEVLAIEEPKPTMDNLNRDSQIICVAKIRIYGGVSRRGNRLYANAWFYTSDHGVLHGSGSAHGDYNIEPELIDTLLRDAGIDVLPMNWKSAIADWADLQGYNTQTFYFAGN